MQGRIPPNIDTLHSFNVNLEGQPETLWFPLYDYQTYDAAGFTGDTLFFQVPIGQGGKSLEDTNMTSGGELPSPINMMVTAIECVFRPGGDVFAAGLPAATVASHWNDLYAVHGGRMSVVLRVGDKESYVREGPLGVFSQSFGLTGAAALADSSTAATDALSKIDYGRFGGLLYQITPIRLISNQDFALTVRSPAAIALPSGVDARWGFRLLGYRYRLAQ